MCDFVSIKFKCLYIVDRLTTVYHPNIAYRVEGAHSALKDYLTSSQGNLCTYFGQYDGLIEQQIKAIKGSLNINIQKQFLNIIGVDVFRLLHCKVSDHALRLLREEYDKGTDPGCDPHCNCRIKLSHGLPCMHDIARHNTSQYPIEPQQIHIFWRTLRFGAMPEDLADDVLRKKVNRLVCFSNYTLVF